MTSESTSPQDANLPFSMEDFAKALDEHDYKFAKGQVVTGKILEQDAEGVYVDIGGKSPGLVPRREVSLGSEEQVAELLPPGEEQEFLIIREQDANGQVLLSRRELEAKRIWEELSEKQEEGKSVQMRVTGVNKGGVTGDVLGLRGFIPRSHLLQKEDLDSLIGQTLTGILLELSPERNKLVLSQRDAARSQVISKLAPGLLIEGQITGIKPYGVFVDLGGVSGLLHVKEISHNRVDSLPAMFKFGQPLKVMIVDIDEWKKRISLSTKILETYPGEILEKFDEVMSTAETRAAQARENLDQSTQPSQ